MANNKQTENQTSSKSSTTERILLLCVSITGLVLIKLFRGFIFPWNIILMAGTTLLVFLYLFVSIKKAYREREIIDKNNTFLEWEEPRKAWHITEVRSFSPLFLVILFVISFVIFFSVFAIVLKVNPPNNPGKDTLSFSKLPAFSVGVSSSIVILYASLWWWARVKIKLTTIGIQKIFHNSPKTWRYDQIKSYHVEPLTSASKTFTLIILQNHKNKTWKIALDDSVDLEKLESILNEQGILKD